MIKKLIITLCGIFLIYSSVALAIKAGIGILPVDAAIATIAEIIQMKVGTIAIFFHGMFFIGQICLERRKFRKMEYLQLLNITFGGLILNFVLYTLLKDLTFSNYVLRLLASVFAFLLGAFGCRLVLETHFVRTSMEGFIQMVADRKGKQNGRLRQLVDVTLVAVTVILTLIFQTEWTLREGTIIAALIFGPAMDFFRKPIQTMLEKWFGITYKEKQSA